MAGSMSPRQNTPRPEPAYRLNNHHFVRRLKRTSLRCGTLLLNQILLGTEDLVSTVWMAFYVTREQPVLSHGPIISLAGLQVWLHRSWSLFYVASSNGSQ